MSDIVSWVNTILTMDIATLGSVNVTLGMLLAGSLIFSFGIGVFKRLRGRG